MNVRLLTRPRITLFLLPAILIAVACSRDAAVPPESGQQEVKPTQPAESTASIVDEIPEIVAKVNDVEISKEALLAQAKSAVARMTQMGSPPPEPNVEFYRMVLDKMISGELLYNDAASRGLTASDDEVEDRMATIQASFPSPDDFDQALASQGTDMAGFERSLRQDLAIQKLIGNEIVPLVTVTDDMMQEFYQANQERMKQPEQVKVSHILIQVGPDADEATRETAKTRAAELLTRIEAGEDFAEIARENSDDKTSSAGGGQLPWVTRGTTVPPFEEAAFALEIGGTSSVVESPFGYHIIRMNERREEIEVPFEQAKEQIRRMLQQQEVQAQIDRRVESLRTEADTQIFL